MQADTDHRVSQDIFFEVRAGFVPRTACLAYLDQLKK